MGRLLYGGLDIAQRTDNAAFTLLERHEDGIFEEFGLKIWPHIDFDQVGIDLGKIWQKERFAMCGYDRLGIGEIAAKLIPPYVPLMEIVSSQPAKHEMINAVKSLFNAGKLKIHTQELYDEILAQEKKVSEAGNVLYQHPSGRHDDRFWSMCYAVKAAQGSVGHGITNSRLAMVPIRSLTVEQQIQKDIEKGLKF